MSLQYSFKDLHELAVFLHSKAVQVASRHEGTVRKKAQVQLIAERDTWLAAYQIVANAKIDTADDELHAEYMREMENARAYAATQIWASLQRHGGDPRWEYAEDGRLLRESEVCT